MSINPFESLHKKVFVCTLLQMLHLKSDIFIFRFYRNNLMHNFPTESLIDYIYIKYVALQNMIKVKT